MFRRLEVAPSKRDSNIFQELEQAAKEHEDEHSVPHEYAQQICRDAITTELESPPLQTGA